MIQNKSILTDLQIEVLRKVAELFGWRKTLHGLHQRLKNKSENQTFLFREFKLLKRADKHMRKKKNYDINELSSLLPGKLRATIKET